jgi:carbon-monoxide dehydrogenase small subunit
MADNNKVIGEIVSFRVNGEVHQVILESPSITLADLLREKLQLTGTKEACRCGECGSCTVLVDGLPTLSCSTLAIAVRNKEILTIEGLTKGDKLHPIQQAFIDHGAIQCGFCTPGMVLMSKALLDENASPTREDVIEALGGNLCRCTGYVKIVEAVLSAAEVMRGSAESPVAAGAGCGRG